MIEKEKDGRGGKEIRERERKGGQREKGKEKEQEVRGRGGTGTTICHEWLHWVEWGD